MSEPKTKNYVMIDKNGFLHFYYIKGMAEMVANVDNATNVKVIEAEEDYETLREWLIGVLRKQQVTLTFEKKDGTMRTMRCSLSSDLVPVYESKGTKAVSEAVIPVYDLDNSGWRSFRVDSLRRIEFEFEA